MLLLHVKEATSFEYIRKVDGVLCESFRQPCNQRGILVDNGEWRRALRDAFRSLFVPLSEVFATIIAHCGPSSPIEVWEEHRSIFITGIRQRLRRHRDAVQDDEQAILHVL